MAFRNPEEEYIHEFTQKEAPLSHHESELADFLNKKLRSEKIVGRLSLPELLQERSPASDHYTSAEIAHDASELARDRIISGTSGRTERANIIEQIMLRDAGNFGWFGNPETTRLIGTTEYDDRRNFVDAVAAFKRKDGTEGYLAIDLVTAKVDSGSLAKKRDGVERFISEGHLYETKYTVDRTDKDGRPVIKRLSKMPWVNIGLDPSSLTELAEHLHAYYCPEAALKEFRTKLGLKAFKQDQPQTPQAMKEHARQLLANHPIAYEIAQEAFAQLESQALLALNVFLDRASVVLGENRPELNHFVEKLKGLEAAIREFRVHLNADPTQVAREETAAALERAYRLLPEFEALEKAAGYPVRQVIKPLLPFVKHFGHLATKRQGLANPEKEDPTVKALSRPWESDWKSRELAAA